MILVIAAALCLLSVPLAGGRISALADIRLRIPGAILVAIGLQVVITSLVKGGSHELHSVLHLVSYALAVWFIWANRHIPGMVVIALGGGSNLLAISLNGGTMPARLGALKTAGLLHTGPGYHNSEAVPHAKLAFLGDIIGVPGPHPIANVVSIGDIVLFGGMLLLLHRTCRPATRSRRGPVFWLVVLCRVLIGRFDDPRASPALPTSAYADRDDSRSSARRTLPLDVLGNSPTKSTIRGYL
jgi:hypothetical protein